MTGITTNDIGQTGIRIAISPEPTDEEAAAVVAVVTALAASRRQDAGSAEPIEDLWQVAGRLESMRDLNWPPHPLDGIG